jgi:NAD(P)-dependent dehydrogenase (short-subunit alcohol dehydrogenase family)
MVGDLDGKRALVTGSSAGIGKAIALELARRGASVAVHGRNPECAASVKHEIEEAGGRAAVSMTTAMAQKFGIDGITSNCVGVGMVLSDSSQILPKIMADTGLDAAAAERKICTEIMKVPVGRFCRVEEVAHAVAFLASPDSGYVNGANLRLDGGMVPTISL